MKEKGKTTTKKSFCLNFWKTLVALTSLGSPRIRKPIFVLKYRTTNFDMLLGHASGDCLMQLECGICISGEGLGADVQF